MLASNAQVIAQPVDESYALHFTWVAAEPVDCQALGVRLVVKIESGHDLGVLE